MKILIDTNETKLIVDDKSKGIDLLSFMKKHNLINYQIEVKENDNKISFGNFKNEKDNKI